MDLLEPGGRKFVELGSGSLPEEEGADAAITPETLSQSPHLKKSLVTFLSSLSLFIPPQQNLSFYYIQDDKCGSLAGKETESIGMYVQRVCFEICASCSLTLKEVLNLATQTCRRQGHRPSNKLRFN